MQWWALTALMAAPAIAGPFVAEPLLWLWAALALPAGFAIGAGGVTRMLVGTLPMEFATPGLIERLGDEEHFRFRVRLGRGRLLRRGRATVTFRGVGDPVVLHPVLAEVDALVGPWTLLVTTNAGACTDGVFDVRVVGEAEGQQWEAQSSWETAALREGRFEAPLERAGSRTVWRDWDVVSVRDPVDIRL